MKGGMNNGNPSLSRATLWEFWRTCYPGLVAPLAGQLVFALFFTSLRASDRLSHDSTVVPFATGIFVMMAIIASSFSHLAQNTFEDDGSGFPFQLSFTRPISSLRLVAVPMVLLVFATPLIYLAAASFFNAVMGASAPLLKPSLLVLNGASCLLAAAWIPVTRKGRAAMLMACVIVFGVAAVSFHYRHEHSAPFLMLVGTAEYFRFSWWHYLLLIGVPICAMGMTVLAVDRQRHGESLGFRWHRTRSIARRSGERAAFGSRYRAQVWYEMKRFGSRVVFASLFAPLLPLILVHYVPRFDPDWEGSALVWMVAILLCPIAYQIAGTQGAIGLIKNGRVWKYSAFDATRPLPIEHMILIKILVIALGSLIGLGWMTCVASADSYLSGDWVHWRFEIDSLIARLSSASWFSWLTAIFSLALAYFGTTYWLLAVGLLMPLHPGKFLALMTLTIFHLVLALRDEHHGWQLAPLWAAYGWILAFGIVAGTFYVVWKALGSGFLSFRVFAIVIVVWLIYVMTTVTFARDLAYRPPAPALALGVSSLLLPLAASAIAPLALASHRHA